MLLQLSLGYLAIGSDNGFRLSSALSRKGMMLNKITQWIKLFYGTIWTALPLGMKRVPIPFNIPFSLRPALPETPDVPQTNFLQENHLLPFCSSETIWKLEILKCIFSIFDISYQWVPHHMAQWTACPLCFCTDSGNIQDRGKTRNHLSPTPENPSSTLTLPVTSPVGNSPASEGTPAALPSLACRTRVRSEPRGCSLFSLGGAGHIWTRVSEAGELPANPTVHWILVHGKVSASPWQMINHNWLPISGWGISDRLGG